jgi:hypothetical protein
LSTLDPGNGIEKNQIRDPGSGINILNPSVADRECLSQITDPDFYPSRIPDPKTAMKDRGEKKFVFIPFLEP